MAEEPTIQEAPPIGAAPRRSILLSGLGFYKLSVRRRQQLAYVFLGSLLAHVIGLIAFGGWTVMRSKQEEATVFRTPPPVRTYEPRKLEHKVKVQNRQRSSSRPAVLPRLVANAPSRVSLPEIKADPKLINTTFQPKFKAVSGKGLGAGLGTGYGTHGFGTGMQTYDFFGIRARGEKVAVLVDVSVSMVEPERGGVAGYMAVKQRLGQVVDSLPDTCLFNVIVFADAAESLEPKLVLANESNRAGAKRFLSPFNKAGNWGLSSGNVRQDPAGVKAAGGTTRLDLALTAALQMQADTILVISDGIPRVGKTLSPAQADAHRERVKAWQAANSKNMEAWDAKWGGGKGVADRVWIPPAKKAGKPKPKPTGPPREGQRAGGGGGGGHWKVVHHQGYRPRPRPPGAPQPGVWTLNDFIKHIGLLHAKYYKSAGLPEPKVYGIGYAIDKDGHRFLHALSKHYKGQYRRVTRIR
ncbi:MAG: hypothetical protein ISS31_09190 [Kiritimatiellae bacterium]|nr:hypothetical protein [Kiritimatiellia bacterium]